MKATTQTRRRSRAKNCPYPFLVTYVYWWAEAAQILGKSIQNFTDFFRNCPTDPSTSALVSAPLVAKRVKLETLNKRRAPPPWDHTLHA